MKSFEDVLVEELKDPEFRREWEASEAEYEAIKAQIRAELAAEKNTVAEFENEQRAYYLPS